MVLLTVAGNVVFLVLIFQVTTVHVLLPLHFKVFF